MSIGVWARTRLASVAQRRGAAIRVRLFSRLEGSDPQPSPPMVSGALVAAEAASTGAGSLVLGAGLLVGRVVAGDRLAVAGATYTVTSTAQASSNRITASITPTLSSDVSAGAAVTPTWSADITLRAMVLQQPSSGVPNAPETQRSLVLSIPASSLPRRPEPGDLIFRGADVLAVLDCSPEMIGEDEVSYRVRAR